MAGGGIRPGISWGKTCEYGYNIQEEGVHIHDFHATLLIYSALITSDLLIIPRSSLSLTDIHGHVVKEILA